MSQLKKFRVRNKFYCKFYKHYFNYIVFQILLKCKKRQQIVPLAVILGLCFNEQCHLKNLLNMLKVNHVFCSIINILKTLFYCVSVLMLK